MYYNDTNILILFKIGDCISENRCRRYSQIDAFSKWDNRKAFDIDFADAIHLFEEDQDIRVIVIHAEGIKNIRGFLDVCRKAVKPILVLKGGKSESGRRVAASHTGSLTGKDELYRALFNQAGIQEIGSSADLGNVVKAFFIFPALQEIVWSLLRRQGRAGS